MKKLQILVPQYSETDSVIKPLLDSIALQQNIDFDDIGVIVGNDGSDTFLSKDLMFSYPYDVEYIKLEHGGVSAARQACLDVATADYVMFCDADDMFFNMCGLWIIFREMEDDGFDMFISEFVEETRDEDGAVVYSSHTRDTTYVHGKVLRRQYLIDKNITWNPELTVHEDSYFNTLAYECLDSSDRGKYCETPFYLWKWRDDSVCRGDSEYMLKTFNNMLDSNTALVNEFLARGMEDKAAYYCASMIYESYYSMNCDEWINQDNQEYRAAVEERFAEYYAEFAELFDSIETEEKNVISNAIRNNKVAQGMNMEIITFDDWLDSLE